MAFHSILFVFLFLPITLFVYTIANGAWKQRVLLIVSLIFYAWGSISDMLLLLVLILINYLFARFIAKGPDCKRRLIEAIVVNVFILFYVKYYGEGISALLKTLHMNIAFESPHMPLGVSFYMFSIISYLIDVYRNNVKVEKNIFNFAFYVAFFPKLIMGPIQRFGDMKEQLKKHKIHKDLLEQGCYRFLCGLAQKVILANTFAMIWAQVSLERHSFVFAWLALLAFTLQIYFDFQGYTQMAIGLANMFGFSLPENFRYPYASKSITEFWQRWHITLGSWFRDYIYIPLGGNRVARRLVIRNLMVVWLLTGIWHGASIHFLLWGGYFGVLIVLEKYYLKAWLQQCHEWLRWLITMLLVMLGWVFFASDSLAQIISFLGQLFMVNATSFVDGSALHLIQAYGLYFVLGILFCTSLPARFQEYMTSRLQTSLWVIKPLLTLLLWICIIVFMVSDTYQSFLYFQF